jgi:hypothetical protein
VTGLIEYAVPQSTTSLYLVVADTVPTGHSTRAAEVAGVSSTVWRAEDSPFDLRRIWTYAHWRARLPPPSAYHIVLAATAPVHRQPWAAQIARACARSVAAKTRGLLVDWATREIVLVPTRPERASFHLGDQWLGFDLHVYDERHAGIPARSAWDDEPRPEDACGALRVQTSGTARFGIPELGVGDVDCGNCLVAQNVLRALTHHLLTDHWAWLASEAATSRPRLTRRLAAVQHVRSDAFGAYWGASMHGDDGFAVTLETSRGLLWVGAPRGEPINEWLARIRSNLRSVAAWPPDDFDAYARLEVPTG